LRDFLKLLYRIAVALVLVFCAAVLAELLPGLKPLDAWMLGNELLLLAITGGTAAFGVFLLLGSVLSLLMQGGAPMSHGEIENHQRSMRDSFAGPQAWRASSYRLLGRGAGSQGHDEFSFSQLKAAFASGAVLRTPLWRRRVCAICGGMLMFFGVFGVVFVLAPMPVKLIVGAAVAYACVRIAWGMARA
jgi:hypothetical protein